MIYIGYYLAAGILVLGGCYLYNHRKPAEKNVLVFAGISDHTAMARLGEALLYLLILALWPAVMAMVLWENRPRRPGTAIEDPFDEKPFEVAEADLQEPLSIEEIEAREKVEDPLGAVSDLPFGHLYSVWQRFRVSLQPEDEVWSFEATWTSTWGSRTCRTGYVARNTEGELGRHFVTGLEDLAMEAQEHPKKC